MYFTSSPSSVFEDTSLDSPGNLYEQIRKIKTMNHMANFLIDHCKNVPKYEKVICETINRFNEYSNMIHIETVRALLTEAIKAYDLVYSSNDNYDTNGYKNPINYGNAMAYVNVLRAYADWLFKGATRPIECVYPAESTNRYRVVGTDKYSTDSRMHTLVSETYIPMLLLMTSPTTIDAYCEIDPNMKRSILHIVLGDAFVDEECFVIDHNKVIDSLGNVLPNISKIIGDSRLNLREELEPYILDIAKSMYVDSSSGIICTTEAMNTFASFVTTLFRANRDEDVISINTSLFYNANCDFQNGMERDLAEAIGSRYYGDDAYMVYKEVPYIFNSHSQDGENWKKSADDIVKRLITYARLLTKSYPDSNDKINEVYVRTALHSIKNITDTLKYVIKEYDKKCKTNEDLDPEIVREIGNHRWIFEDKINPYEEDVSEEEAFESKISRKAARTVKRDKATRKAFNKYKDVHDRVHQADTTLTKWVHSMRDLVMGDTRTEIIEGKNYTVLGLFRKIFTDAAIWSFFGPVKGLIALIVKHALKKKTTNRERKAIIRELENEIEICEVKIEHAQRADDNKAVYKLMRIKGELIEAKKRIAEQIGTAFEVSDYVKETLKTRKGALK